MGRRIVGLHMLVMHAHFSTDTPERAAFKARLIQVARALREIERSEDVDPNRGDETAAIQACLSSLQLEGDGHENDPVAPGAPQAAAPLPAQRWFCAGCRESHGGSLERWMTASGGWLCRSQHEKQFNGELARQRNELA